MRKVLALGAALAVSGTVAAAAAAETPFPTPTYKTPFVAAQTVTTNGTMTNYFTPGSTVVVRAYAADGKGNLVLPKDVKYFYATIPNQPNVKLKYDPKAQGANARLGWVGSWNVPSTYPEGIVNVKVLMRLKNVKGANQSGSFVQMPIATSMLTISKTAPTPPGSIGTDKTALGGSALDAAIYVDAVNGTRPSGAAPRPIGCTQTNVFKRGEQLVIRSWGVDTSSGTVFNLENVGKASFSLPGVNDVTLNWGAHGVAPNQVWFWANAVIVPLDYPLGDQVVKVTYTMLSGKVATFQYGITIIP
jgi:hypothetical protein